MAKGEFNAKRKNYLEIARQRVVRAADVIDYPKLLIYARKKAGKTTFGLSAGVEDTLVIDPENGAKYKKEMNPYLWPIASWKDLDEVYGALRTGELSPKFLQKGKSSKPFSFALVDGMTKINHFALTYVRQVAEETNLDRQPGFIQQRDYGKSGDLMKQLMANFHTLKMGVVYTAQEKMKSSAWDEDDEDVENPEYQMIPELPDSVRNDINALVDVIGRLYVVRVEDKGGNKKAVRRLQVGNHPAYDTGYRSEFVIPDVIKNPTIPKLLQLIKEGQS